MATLRRAAVAGSFYPAASAELKRNINALLAAAGSFSGVPPKAIIVPHAGYMYSGPIAAAAYARLLAGRARITRVVLLGPSHYVPFRGIAAASAELWQTPLGEVPVDGPAIAALRRNGLADMLDAAHVYEHSLEVQLPFLQTALDRFELVPLAAGEAPAETIAAALEALWDGSGTVIVISTDLSHYLDYRTCRAVDARTAAAIERFNECELGSESTCGRVPLAGLLLAARRRGMAIERLDLRNSGDTAGPRDRVVGYGSWALNEPAGSA